MPGVATLVEHQKKGAGGEADQEEARLLRFVERFPTELSDHLLRNIRSGVENARRISQVSGPTDGQVRNAVRAFFQQNIDVPFLPTDIALSLGFDIIQTIRVCRLMEEEGEIE